MDGTDLIKVISNDNTRHIKYVLIFFLFFIALSQNMFRNIFGCNVSKLVNNNVIRHLICFTFLFLLLDFDPVKTDETTRNPITTLGYSTIIYSFVFLLLQTSMFYIYFISVIVLIFIILDKVKNYYVHKIKDQEILQEQLGFLYKLNNVLVIISILTIIIGFLTSPKLSNVYNNFVNTPKCNKK